MRGQLASLGRKNQRRRERRSGRRGKPASQDRRGTTSHPASQPVRKERMSGRRGQPASQDRRVRTQRLRMRLRRRKLLRNSQPARPLMMMIRRRVTWYFLWITRLLALYARDYIKMHGLAEGIWCSNMGWLTRLFWMVLQRREKPATTARGKHNMLVITLDQQWPS